MNTLARLNDIPDAGAIVVRDGDRSLLLARRGDAVFAYENRCAHAAYPLERQDGHVLVQAGRFLVCPHHGASYALDTGACAGGPCNGAGLTPVAIEVEAGEVRLSSLRG